MKRIILALVLAALATSPHPAAAQVILHDTESYRSPQRFLLELRFGPYSPNVDDEFNGVTPYQDFFGKSHRLMTQLELDYQVFQGFGSAAVGVSVGYFRETANAWVDPGADQTWRRAHIPLVPYVKVGLNYTLWSVTDGNDKIAESSPTGRGRGGTLGWQGAVGAAVVLNVLDPGGARELDAETGINNTQVFFELAHFGISGMGQKDRLHVGDNTWLTGLGFEF